MLVWRISVGVISTVNGLDQGLVTDHNTSTAALGSRMEVEATAAGMRVMRSFLRDASEMARVRRGLHLTGAHDAAAQLLKQPLDELGYMKSSSVKQVSLIASKVVEPITTRCVNLLDALPEEDAHFYAHEVNVLDTHGKSAALFREIESKYGFIGGEKSQYIEYLSRPDVASLWRWSLQTQVRATAGISCALKKDGVSQCKLMMQCASNYMWCDPRPRGELGVMGGSALARNFIPSDNCAIAACDEDSAFTFVQVPEWMEAWCAGPPLIAAEVWHLLTDHIRASVAVIHMLLPCIAA